MLKIAINLFYKPTKQLKQFLLQNRDLYMPINGGANLKHDRWCQQYVFFDDFVDGSISSHNNKLSENTAIYWLWKSLDSFKDVDYIGFNHCQRLFPRSELYDYQQYDMIVAQPIESIYSLEWQYGCCHSIDDLAICIQTLKDHSLKLGQQFETYMKMDHDNLAPMNMFVMKKTLFIEWCQFIFPILLKLEDTIDVESRDSDSKRAICFLEEQIFGFWCKNKIADRQKVKHAAVEEHFDWRH